MTFKLRPRIGKKSKAPGEVRTATEDHTPTEYTRYQVKTMAACGIPKDIMAEIVGCSTFIIDKYYKEEYLTGQYSATYEVAKRLLWTALHGFGKEALAAQMFWLKTRGGWKDTSVVENTGANGGPIDINDKRLTDEERVERVLQLLVLQRANGTGRIIDGDARKLGPPAGTSD